MGRVDMTLGTMTVEVLTGPPGSGKSYQMRQEAIQNPGLYIFVYPTINLINEQLQSFNEESTIPIAEAHSSASGTGTVQDRLDRHKAYFADKNITHAVVLITHEGMMGADLSGYQDWHIRIDEAPNSIQSGKIKVPASKDLFKQIFSITPFGTHGWGHLSLINPKSNWQALANDDAFKNVAEMMKQAGRSHGVFVDTHEWKDSFGWCSVWPLASLAGCRSIKIAGATYENSLGALVAKKWEGNFISFTPVPLASHRTMKPKVRVHYFTEAHEGTTTFWKTNRGNRFIRNICDFLVENEPELGYWSANETVKPLLNQRVNGKPIRVKAAGLNKYDDETSCALIYSSKSVPEDKTLKELFEISDAEIVRAREEEDILQFVMRGAIRRGDFGGNYDVYLYSKRQAQLVVDRLTASGLGNPIELVPEPDAGIMNEPLEPLGPIRTFITDRKKAKKKKSNQSKDAERKQKVRAADAEAKGRTVGQNGRQKGQKDSKPRKSRSKKATLKLH